MSIETNGTRLYMIAPKIVVHAVMVTGVHHVYFGSNSKKVDDKNCFLMCCLYGILTNCYLCFIPHYFERQSLRKKYNLKEDPCDDLAVTLCCSPCALCQEAREMKARGNLQGVSFQPNNNASAVVVHEPGVNPTIMKM